MLYEGALGLGAAVGEGLSTLAKGSTGIFGSRGTVNGLGRAVVEAGADLTGNSTDIKNVLLNDEK
ncbi:hypothetical protein CWE13_10445 [Aliidiomarina shirensis]|uniref:Uncharacterized protein n=1 Tax=Aliidiomarina shirensis TaxID=1048642 RepID=A0A432WQ69_9GAMM|nr:hypothetical protein CWE13_10445 [Aliidiomarina shirensis]